jgi:hypothetical protein
MVETPEQRATSRRAMGVWKCMDGPGDDMNMVRIELRFQTWRMGTGVPVT